jgi:hypothetical protein
MAFALSYGRGMHRFKLGGLTPTLANLRAVCKRRFPALDGDADMAFRLKDVEGKWFMLEQDRDFETAMRLVREPVLFVVPIEVASDSDDAPPLPLEAPSLR